MAAHAVKDISHGRVSPRFQVMVSGYGFRWLSRIASLAIVTSDLQVRYTTASRDRLFAIISKPPSQLVDVEMPDAGDRVSRSRVAMARIASTGSVTARGAKKPGMK